jgi:hypothetical protein
MIQSPFIASVVVTGCSRVGLRPASGEPATEFFGVPATRTAGCGRVCNFHFPAREGEASYFSSGGLLLRRKVSGGSGVNLCAGMRSGLQHIRVPVRTEGSTDAPAFASRARYLALPRPRRAFRGANGATESSAPYVSRSSESALRFFRGCFARRNGLMLWRTDSPSDGLF